MKKRIYIIILTFLLVASCTPLPPVKDPQYTESNIPKAQNISYVPYFRQGYNQCFPACLYMIFKFYGKEIAFQEIDDWIRKAKGTLSSAAEEFCTIKKFNTYVFYDWKGDKIKYFLAQGYPLIAGVEKKGFGLGLHVVVLTGYDDEKQVFYTNDPAINNKEISYKKFKEERSMVDGNIRYYTLLIWPPTTETNVPQMVTNENSTVAIPPGAEIIPKPEWVEGDTWIRQSDQREFISEIEKADSSGIILRQGQTRNYFDNDFAFLKIVSEERVIIEFNPPYKGSFLFPLWVGKRWQNGFSEKNFQKGTTYNFVELFEVKGWEDIQTPAGLFKTLRIEVNQENLDARGSWTYTLWYSPEVKSHVKSSSKDIKAMNWILISFSLKKVESQTKPDLSPSIEKQGEARRRKN